MKVCENCEVQIAQQKVDLHQAFCIKYNIRCAKCKEMIDKRNKEEHYCMLQMSNCKKCREPVERLQVLQHHKQCKSSGVSCEFCETMVKYGQYSSHVKTCGARTEICESCSVYVPLKDKFYHVCKEEVQKQPVEKKRLHRREEVVSDEEIYQSQSEVIRNPEGLKKLKKKLRSAQTLTDFIVLSDEQDSLRLKSLRPRQKKSKKPQKQVQESKKSKGGSKNSKNAQSYLDEDMDQYLREVLQLSKNNY